MTLLELLTVLVIFSIMLGITAAIMQGSNRDLGVYAAANHASAVLRVAHQESRSSAAPSWVIFDVKQNRIFMLMKETVGEWHLEDDNNGMTTGAFGRDGKLNNAKLVQARVGKGAQLSGSASLVLGAVPDYTPDQGISIEFWYLRRSGRGRGTLASIGDAVEIVAESDGHVEARVGNLRATSSPMSIPNDAWCLLQVVYSGRELKLILNRREVQTVPGKTELPRGAAFNVGGSGFTGVVDEVRLGLIIPREEYYLPSECTMTFKGHVVPENGEVVVAFDSEGRLETSVSPQPFEITVKSPTAEQTISVGRGGTLQR
jgi:type II secretory pathway pseudopilin PulG